MTLSWAEADNLADEHGESYFILDVQRFKRNYENLIEAFRSSYKNVQIGYSYKTNYTPFLCKAVNELGGFAEVVSSMEYELAKRVGVPGSRVIFNGPYKAEGALSEASISGATINLDGKRDLDLLVKIAKRNPNVEISAVIRSNFSSHEGDRSRFGIDVTGREFQECVAAITHFSNISLRGLHAHLPNRDLESFSNLTDNLISLARSVFPDGPPEILNIGGGFFSNMPETLRNSFDVPPASFEDYAEVIGGKMTRAFGGLNDMPQLFL